MSDHANISPSAFARVRRCPASLDYAAKFPNESNAAAERGTLMHEYMQALVDQDPLPDIPDDDRDICEEVYDWVLEQDFDEIHTEVRLPVGESLGLNDPDICWGTADLVGIKGNTITNVDYKFGFNDVQPGKEQDLMYLSGAIHVFGPFEEMRVVIIQPASGGVKQLLVEPEALDAFRIEAKVGIYAALSADPEFNPGEEQCRWCPAAGQCKAQAEWALKRDFGVPVEDLEGEEIARILQEEAAIRQFLDKVKEKAQVMLEFDPDSVPGWGIEQKAGRAQYADESEVVAACEEAGLDLDEVAPRKPIAQSKLKKVFDVEPYLIRPEGKKGLVRTE